MRVAIWCQLGEPKNMEEDWAGMYWDVNGEFYVLFDVDRGFPKTVLVP